MKTDKRMGELSTDKKADKRIKGDIEMKDNEIPYQDLTYKIIGAAMDVHNKLGPGYDEETYQRAMEKALPEQGVSFEPQKAFEVYFNDQVVGLHYLDLLIEDKIVVELKALSHLLTNDEMAQVIEYLKVTGRPVGLLINFGRKKLEYKRILPPKKISSEPKRIGRYGVVMDREALVRGAVNG